MKTHWFLSFAALQKKKKVTEKEKSDQMLHQEVCPRVHKLDCIGHVKKRMGKALRDLRDERGKLSDGKPVGGKSGILQFYYKLMCI